MARKVRDANLETRTARSRLPVRHKPYFRLIEPGLHLGFRRLTSGPGTWLKRCYVGKGKYVTENLRTTNGGVVLADDYEEADGERILSFAQAQRAARGPRAARGGLTVADVIAAYLDYLRGDGRSAHSLEDARRRVAAHILPSLGGVKVSALTPEQLRRWRDALASTAARVRTPRGTEQRYRTSDSRARRNSADRTWKILRAALNRAFQDGKIETDHAWRKVKGFRGVDTARVRYLSTVDAKRLVNAAGAEFQPLLQAALVTGCRYGELTGLTVADFNPDARTLAIHTSKAGKPRHVVLTDEGVALFAALTAGRSGADLILRRSNGEPWRASNQGRLMREACERAKITPAISFHGLRHTVASLAVMNNMPLTVVARNLGHANTKMVEKFYGHLAPNFVTEAVRKYAPRFGFSKAAKGTVTPLRKAGADA
jgi:integrase